MQEENISGKESLAIIESMINKAKNQFSENGHLYLLWGWAVFVCSIAQFILMNYVCVCIVMSLEMSYALMKDPMFR